MFVISLTLLTYGLMSLFYWHSVQQRPVQARAISGSGSVQHKNTEMKLWPLTGLTLRLELAPDPPRTGLAKHPGSLGRCDVSGDGAAFTVHNEGLSGEGGEGVGPFSQQERE